MAQGDQEMIPQLINIYRQTGSVIYIDDVSARCPPSIDMMLPFCFVLR